MFRASLGCCDKAAKSNYEGVGDCTAEGALLFHPEEQRHVRPQLETEVPETPEPDWSKTLDIVMLTLFAARQRTATEYRTLLAGCDFELRGRTETQAGITVFEAS